MTQAIGAFLVLIGAMMWHIASAHMPHHNVTDIWNDFLKIARGDFSGK